MGVLTPTPPPPRAREAPSGRRPASSLTLRSGSSSAPKEQRNGSKSASPLGHRKSLNHQRHQTSVSSSSSDARNDPHDSLHPVAPPPRPQSTPLHPAGHKLHHQHHQQHQQGCELLSTRYSKLLVGAVGDGTESEAPSEIGHAGLERRGSDLVRSSFCMAGTQRQGSKPPLAQSVFLAESGWDRRILPKCKAASLDMKRPRNTRSERRRLAVVAYGQRRLQIVTAVRSMAAWHPRHMRTLTRILDDNGSSLKGKPVRIAEGEPLPLWQVQQYADDTGLDEEVVAKYWSAFHRYDIDDGALVDHSKAREALADIGLEARTSQEKQEVAEMIKDFTVHASGQLAFFEFLVLQKEVRTRMKGLRQKLVADVFTMCGTKLTGKIRISDLDLHTRGHTELQPRTPQEFEAYHALAKACDADSDGLVTFQEFQELAENLWEALAAMRREEEQAIKKRTSMESSLFHEIRSDLRLYYEIFKRYDHKDAGVMPCKSLWMFFMDIGMLSAKNHEGFDFKDAALRSMLHTASQQYRLGVTFPTLLRLILSGRSQCKLLAHDELRSKFMACDRDHSGEVTMKEMCSCLEELDMLPHTREEQLAIHRLLEDLDHEGSGSFEFGDFQDFFQRLAEQHRHADRERLRRFGLDLGFNDEQFQGLLMAFHRMERDDKGQVSKLTLAQFLSRHGRTLQIGLPVLDEPRMRSFQRQAQRTQQAPVDVLAFLHIMRYIAMDSEFEQRNIDTFPDSRFFEPDPVSRGRIDPEGASRLPTHLAAESDGTGSAATARPWFVHHAHQVQDVVA